jgi:two-component system, chemotaxis family, sensor kinase CheA
MDQITLDVLLRTPLSSQEVQELLEMLAGTPGTVEVEPIQPGGGAAAELGDGVQKIGRILLDQGIVDAETLESALREHKPLGERLVAAGAATPHQVQTALSEQQKQREAVSRRIRSEAATSIRVSSLKLDKLVNLIGELVTVQERLSQVSGVVRDAREAELAMLLQEFNLQGIAEEVSRLTNDLRDNALSIRMLPIEATFSKFKRLVHDLSGELGKEIDLTMSGGETEIDKTVIDKLDEPLMHLIRNCADHGIERPDVRTATGKPRRGTVHLSAEHVGGNVVIHVRDDGAGLSRDRILARAIERNLVPSGAEMSDREVFGLIFMPGFSTAEQVTSVSGRGVGMDVVKRTIEDLRGHVEVFSTPGQGTQIDVTLPLTLAIIDGLLVTLGGQPFILPLSVVEECIELRRGANKGEAGGDLVNVRGALVPYVRLRERFTVAGEAPPIEQIVISRINDQRIGFVVDTVVGEYKTVIKPLGRIYRKVPEFSGATILGDGSIAIILDAGRLLKQS